MKLGNILFLAALAVASPTHPTSDAAKVSYDGYHIYKIVPTSAKEAQNLQRRFSRYHTHWLRDALSVVIPAGEVDDFAGLGLNIELINPDLGAYIRSTDRIPTYDRRLRKRGDLPDVSWFDSYHDYSDHLQFWDDLVEAFPDNSKKFELGQSWENRTIYGYHLHGANPTQASSSSSTKPIILWHATVHAREWISTMVIEYLAYQLIDGYRTGDANATAYLDHYDFYLVPFHNPDGFRYTQTHDRLWRKNRQPRANTACVGTDGNRNWKFEWDAEPPEGGSTPDPCGQTFRGDAPGDTPENAALDAFSARLLVNNTSEQQKRIIRSFVDFHSYGQLVLTPYGYTCEEAPATLPRMLEVAAGTARAIEAASTRNGGEGEGGGNGNDNNSTIAYVSGRGCEILYFTTGNSRDHHYAVHGAAHSWTLELSPADSAGGGFVLPPSQIGPVIREQWAGQQWLLNEVWED